MPPSPLSALHQVLLLHSPLVSALQTLCDCFAGFANMQYPFDCWHHEVHSRTHKGLTFHGTLLLVNRMRASQYLCSCSPMSNQQVLVGPLAFWFDVRPQEVTAQTSCRAKALLRRIPSMGSRSDGLGGSPMTLQWRLGWGASPGGSGYGGLSSEGQLRSSGGRAQRS